MVNESALKDTLLALATSNRTNYIMFTSVLNELAALRETVRGLDPTFSDVMENRRAAEAESGSEIVRSVIAGHDQIIQRLTDGYVC